MPEHDVEKDLQGVLNQNRNAEAELNDRPASTASESLEHISIAKDVEKDIEQQGRISGARKVVRRMTTTTSTVESSSSDAVIKEEDTQPLPWYDRINPLKRRKVPPVPQERTVSREHGASIVSLMTFQWMNPVMTVGYLRPLELGDVWLVNPNRSGQVLTPNLMASFKRRVAAGERYPLIFALHETFKGEFWFGGMCNLASSIFQVLSPFLTRYLIQFANDAYDAQRSQRPAPNIGKGIGIVVAITFLQICQSLGTNQFIYHGMMIGGQARAVLINAIFDKSMKISGRAKAGGKAVGDEQTSNGIDVAALKTEKHSLFAAMAAKRGKGPKSELNQGKGVAGDGTGWSNGKIVNLMSVDTYRVDQASGMFHLIWTSPILVIIVLILLCINIGYSALSGYALLVIGMPLLTKSIKSLFVRRRKINKITDQRVSLTQEILSSVRFVKFFGWENSFLERLKELRRREIRAIQVLLAIRNAINAVSMALPVFASMLAFITYSLSDHSLNPARIFSSLALFNSLRMPLNLLPLVIGQVTDAYASLGRIEEFLLSEEQQDEILWDEGMDSAIEMQHASFTWERNSSHEKDQVGTFQTKAQIKEAKDAHKREKKAEKMSKKHGEPDSISDDVDSSSDNTQLEPFRLHDIDFTVGRNELLAVIGSVGSGKSSLLAALAGDMRKTGGTVRMGANRAFCPQYAWIQNTSLKENILFGKPYKSRWYNQVVDACALRPDLEMLPAGDQTEIGERGITVSGGQKQRLNIARAIYFNADIILMDDPLSAVDAHVGRHIMDEAICGIMKDKCRILATHQLHVLNRCDRIIWMNEGRIESIDTFDNLMRDNHGFQQLMATTAQEEVIDEKDKSDDEDEIGDEKKRAKKSTQRAAVALMQQEERAVRSISWGVYGAYIKASGSIVMGPLIFIVLVLANCANIATSLWLSYWTSNRFGFPNGAYIGGYAGLGVLQALLMYTFATLLSTGGTNASKAMLQRAMTRVLRAPMSFFDTTPLGRITNRFSKDIDSMDNNLTDAFRMYLITLTMILSVFALIIAFFHYFAIALVPLLFIFLFSASYFRASAREMKRHESVLRSSVFARFGEAISGTASIRAYGLQDYFSGRIRESIDQMDSAYFLTFSNQRWLAVRLDAIGNLLVFTTGILVVTSRFNVSPSIAGLVLSYILAIVQIIQFTVRQLAEVENNMNATERLHYYGTQLEEEAPAHLGKIPDSWPQSGEIIFEDVQMRYRAGLPLVLQGLDFKVQGGERIGIVGRTGAGKSSIMTALFRLTELSGGSIKIDDVDIATVGLEDLRSRLAIIPQDPTLFRGTIRSNLDPFSEHNDLELWAALRKADLIDGEQEASHGLDSHGKNTGRIHLDSTVEEEGLNFSLGQRQLMALARALVRDSRIIVCDEATSSVDFETDQKIQKTMATGFKGKTLLCIAHRLKTIIRYDRICVMDAGRIAELDEPIKLYDRGGIFRSMCDRSGIRREDFFVGD
jgi:ATP-binding cassette, subfamily C (CFTR/MRP), member 1